MATFAHLLILASLAFVLGHSKCSDPTGLESLDMAKLIAEWNLVLVSEVEPRTKCSVMRHFVDDPTGTLKLQSRYCDSGLKTINSLSSGGGQNATLILAYASFEASGNDSTKFSLKVTLDQRGSVPFDQTKYNKLILSDNCKTYLVWYLCMPKSYVDPEPADMVMIFWKSRVPVDRKTIKQVIIDAKEKVPNAYEFHGCNDECCQF